MPNQYENEANVQAHVETTGPEIWRQTGGAVTHVFLSLGTCGTVTGLARYLREKNPEVKVIAVQPTEGHDVPGLRNVRQLDVSKLFDPSLIDDILEIDFELAYTRALELCRTEGLLAGPSAGLIYEGARRVVEKAAAAGETGHGRPDVPRQRLQVHVQPDETRPGARRGRRPQPNLIWRKVMSEYAHPEVLVSTDWVKEHLDDPNVKLVEIDVDTQAYGAGHVPGAVGFDWRPSSRTRSRRDIVSKEEFERLMGEAGISPDDTVVVYGDNNNWFAAYGFWLMKLYGHEDVRLMNGGRVKWLNEDDKELTADAPKVTATEYTAKEPDHSSAGEDRRRRSGLSRTGTGASTWSTCAARTSSPAR